MRIKQIFYRLWYLCYKRKYRDTLFLPSTKISGLQFIDSISRESVYFTEEGINFEFHNLSKTFPVNIDWNELSFGKLWNYQLNYFEFLHQKDCPVHLCNDLIRQHFNNRFRITVGMEAYPLSLRCLNMIKYFVRNDIHEFDQYLYSQYNLLSRSFEYHLLGNHLLENAVSLYLGGIYFQQNKWRKKAGKELKIEIAEQILDDGAHFELSPMYHQVILIRLIDLYVCLKDWPGRNVFDDELLNILNEQIPHMLGWLRAIEFGGYQVLPLNDSAPWFYQEELGDVFELAHDCGIETSQSNLKSSGYRKYEGINYQLLTDVGDIGPKYIPGHAHADTFSYILNTFKEPIIVDTGISSYSSGKTRDYERSTQAHNTVAINGLNSSDVYGAFRVGKRAHIVSVHEKNRSIKASHDGYKNIGCIHEREFIFSDHEIIIIDKIIQTQSAKRPESISYIHFAPGLQIDLKSDGIVSDQFTMVFENAIQINLTQYQYGHKMNKTILSNCVEVQFDSNLKTFIKILENNEN